MLKSYVKHHKKNKKRPMSNQVQSFDVFIDNYSHLISLLFSIFILVYLKKIHKIKKENNF